MAAAGGTAVDPFAFTLMLDAQRRALTRLGEFTTHPTAFAIVAAFTVAWLLFSPGTFGWAAVASLATWMMTLFINRTGIAIRKRCMRSLMNFFARTVMPGRSSRLWTRVTLRILKSIVASSASETRRRTAKSPGALADQCSGGPA